ncbi:MAG: pyrimidine-nucleoside phosphorylase [Clostridia bacterium]|jgi:pyrimidine-nucleoside phosphorylase|nr:pyrimidine-nucleoside phosphorylase [Clostridia bacterium]
MRMYDIIFKKRNGEELTKEEIDFFIQGYTKGIIPDYQASALLMAIYFQGMNKRETAELTLSMVHSGTTIDLSSIKGIKVDKHSTGGVGDKTTLVLAPMVAAAGVPVAKMSGRGLGHTGGTLDKLESIEGFCVDLQLDHFIKNVNEIKIAVCGQTGDLAPADKKLYALRDVTATVDNVSLIASSIMSKKLASGADAIVLDVKTGSGAFMKTIDDSFILAKEMVDIGTNLNKNVIAMITEMNEPLGYAVGNSLEVQEAVATLKGHGPEDLLHLCIELGAAMLVVGGRTSNMEEAREILGKTIKDGTAIEKLKDMVKAQYGNCSQIDNPNLLPQSKHIVDITAETEGYVHGIDAEEVGRAALVIGAGRETKESPIDYSVGILLIKKVGDKITKGDILARVHINDMLKLEECKEKLVGAYDISMEIPEKRPLIFGKVDKEGIHKF